MFIAPLYFFLFLIAIGLMFVGWFFQERMPAPHELDARLKVEPLQQKTTLTQFNHTVGGVSYYIKPLYTYELYGFVVSKHVAGESFFDKAHKSWGDRINIADLCVVWGENAMSGIYEKVQFSSGEWTCFFQAKDGNWSGLLQHFNLSEVGNNHMLAANDLVAKGIYDAQIGDQIHFKGYLVEYGTADRRIRSTSITRDDTGNGACETVFTTEFNIIKRVDQFFWQLFWCGAFLLVVVYLLWLFTPTQEEYENEGDRDDDEELSLYDRQRLRARERTRD